MAHSAQPWGVKAPVDTSAWSNRELYDDNERILKGTFPTFLEGLGSFFTRLFVHLCLPNGFNF